MLSKKTMFLSILFICFFVSALYYNISTIDKVSQENPFKAVIHSSVLSYMPDYSEGPRITADSAILMEVTTGQILYAKNEHLTRSPASTTKIMTAIVALERGNMDDIVTVSSRAARVGGSSLWLQEGDRVTLEELIRGTLIRSGNDGSVAIGEHISGSITEFTKIMTGRARQLGALNTNFTNPHGLTASTHHSTAYDLALISRYAMKFPVFSDSVSSKYTTIDRLNSEWIQEVQNTNKLLWSFDGADGIKTGTTSDAGHCLVASATRNDRQLISVVLHSDNRWRDSAVLLDYGFNKYEMLKLAEKGEFFSHFNLVNAQTDVKLIAEANLYCSIEKDKLVAGNLEMEIEIYTAEIMAPVNRFERLGRIIFCLDGEEIGFVQLISDSTIEPDSIFKRLFSVYN